MDNATLEVQLKQLLRKMRPTERGERPSRRIEDYVETYEEEGIPETWALIVDGHMPESAAREMAQWFFRAVRGLSYSICASKFKAYSWSAAGIMAGGHFMKPGLLQGLLQAYAQQPDAASWPALARWLGNSARWFDAVFVLTEGSFLVADGEPLQHALLGKVIWLTCAQEALFRGKLGKWRNQVLAFSPGLPTEEEQECSDSMRGN